MAMAARLDSRSVRGDEWHVCVEADELATLNDGSPAPAGAVDEDLFYPCCFRDATEIRRATDGEQR
jgi:hypothetical protein